MRWSISTPLLVAAGADLVLGAHNHRIHHHGHIKPHVEVAPRDLNLIDINRIPPDMLVEIRTLTTTVFEDCVPTNTRYVTTTVFEDYPEPTTTSKAPASQELPMYAFPDPAPVENILEPATATIHTIASKPTSSAAQELPQPTQSTTSEALPQFVRPRPAYVQFSEPQTSSHEETTTIHMTKTVTDTATATPSVSSQKMSSSASNAAPSPSDTSIEDRPLIPEATETNPAPQEHQLLPILPSHPSILPDNPTDIIPHLPIPALDEVIHPQEPHAPSDIEWTAHPADNDFSTRGFGGRSKPSGTGISYHGNVGKPWGSNIIAVSQRKAHKYKYVVRFTGANSKPWTVIIWNKIGPDGKMDGWYGHSALTFVLAPGETKYVAFDEDSVGAWGAAPGSDGLPTDDFGGYTSTWGEFSFGVVENDGWSGWDVSAIQAQIAKQKVQGMRICEADGHGCSILTRDAKKVVDAYTEADRHHDGIGGAAPPGPVRLVVDLDYKE